MPVKNKETDVNKFSDLNRSSENNLSLIHRSQTSLVKKEVVQAVNAPLVITSRRSFLVAAAAATAGLFIKPLSGFAQTEPQFVNAKQIFLQFGQALALRLTAQLPVDIPGLREIATIILTNIFNGGFRGWKWKWGSFRDNLQILSRVLGATGSEHLFNMASHFITPLTQKLATTLNNKFPMLSLPGTLGLKENVAAVLSNAANRQGMFRSPVREVRFLPAVSSAEKEEFIYLKRQQDETQKYFFPNPSDSDFGGFVQSTMLTPLALTASFEKPQFYPTESGALVFVDYAVESTETKSNGQIKKGVGKSIIHIVPPSKRRAIKTYIDNNSDFLTNTEKRREFAGVLKSNQAEGQVTDNIRFKFKAD